MKHTFKFGLFSKNVQMFNEGNMGVVIEKEPQVVCVYGTDETYDKILCAIPLCHPKLLKGLEYTVEFCTDECAKIAVGDIKIIINFASKKCSNNKGVQNYGSDAWGQDVTVAWDENKF